MIGLRDNDAHQEHGDAGPDSAAGAAGLPPEQVKTELERLTATSRRFPSKAEIAQVPGLRESIESTGGVGHWARELGVAAPGKKLELTVDQIRDRLRSHIERLGRFPWQGEAGEAFHREIE